MDAISSINCSGRLVASIPSDILSKLKPHQPEIVTKTVSGLATGNFLNGSDLGTGKTFCALAAAKIMGFKVLAVCRVNSRSMWLEVGKYFGFRDGDVYSVNREALKTGKTEFGHWELGELDHRDGKRDKKFVWTLPGNDFLLIVDEIHNDSAMTNTANSLMLRAAVSQGLKIMGLSGTAGDDPRKMRAIGYMLGLHQDYDFYQWLFKYGATKDDWNCGLNGKILSTKAGKANLEGLRRKELGRIHAQMTAAGRFVRVRKSEIPGFPKCTVSPIAVDLEDTDEINLVYQEMQQELAALKAKTSNRTELEIIMRARQRTELLEVPGIVGECEEDLAEGASVAIFVNFKDTIRALAERLKTDCIFTGDESQAVRALNLGRFQSDESRVILVNKQAGGESIGLHDQHGNYPRVGIVIPGFRAVDENQVLGRLPRDGAKTPSIYKILFIKNSLEEVAYHRCKARADRYAALNGDFAFQDEDLMGWKL